MTARCGPLRILLKTVSQFHHYGSKQPPHREETDHETTHHTPELRAGHMFFPPPSLAEIDELQDGQVVRWQQHKEPLTWCD